jgi:hypothetical protein
MDALTHNLHTQNERKVGASMSKRLRHAEADMRCLGAYWRREWDGPHAHPKGSSYWKELMGLKPSPSTPVDEERAMQVFRRWVKVLEQSNRMANVLVYKYRDGWEIPSRLVNQALEMLSRV